MKNLVLNSGSSSQKSSLFEIRGGRPEHSIDPLWEAANRSESETESASLKRRSAEILVKTWRGATTCGLRSGDC